MYSNFFPKLNLNFRSNYDRRNMDRLFKNKKVTKKERKEMEGYGVRKLDLVSTRVKGR